MSYKGGGGTISQQSWSELSKCVTAYNWGKVVGRAMSWGHLPQSWHCRAAAPSLGSCDPADSRGQEGSCQLSHGTLSWQASKSSGSQTLVMFQSAPQWWSLH